MTKREEILKKQRELDVLFTAWMNEKKKHEVLTFQRPDSIEKVIRYTKY